MNVIKDTMSGIADSVTDTVNKVVKSAKIEDFVNAFKIE